MKQPTVSEAYTMIRALQKRALPGDGAKIHQLQELILDSREKAGLLAIERFFSSAPDPLEQLEDRDVAGQVAKKRGKP